MGTLKGKQVANVRYCQIILMRSFGLHTCCCRNEGCPSKSGNQLGSCCYKHGPLKSVDNGEKRSNEGRNCHSWWQMTDNCHIYQHIIWKVFTNSGNLQGYHYQMSSKRHSIPWWLAHYCPMFLQVCMNVL